MRANASRATSKGGWLSGFGREDSPLLAKNSGKPAIYSPWVFCGWVPRARFLRVQRRNVAAFGANCCIPDARSQSLEIKTLFLATDSLFSPYFSRLFPLDGERDGRRARPADADFLANFRHAGLGVEIPSRTNERKRIVFFDSLGVVSGAIPATREPAAVFAKLLAKFLVTRAVPDFRKVLFKDVAQNMLLVRQIAAGQDF